MIFVLLYADGWSLWCDNQTARQEELITELEEDLEAALTKVQIREKELEVWKDRVRRLTEGSFVSASGIPSSRSTL